MDSLWWGSVFVFGGGCVAAVRTGASKDSAYGKWKQKREEKFKINLGVIEDSINDFSVHKWEILHYD